MIELDSNIAIKILGNVFLFSTYLYITDKKINKNSFISAYQYAFFCDKYAIVQGHIKRRLENSRCTIMYNFISEHASLKW